MSPTAPSILPDTRALRAVFDADFQSLVAQARGHLGDAASLAPRVAEGALVRAWDARSRLQTQAQLTSFLADDIKSAAARALARRAASHRAGSPAHATPAGADQPSGGQIDMAQSWAFILDAIHVDPHTANEQKLIAEAARHEAAEAVTSATKSFPLGAAIAIGVVIVVAALGSEMWVSHVSTEAAIADAVASPHGKVTATPFGQTGNVTLADQTKVRVAPDSRLLVPTEFGGKVRVVRLDGAADFDVPPGQSGTFRVYLKNFHAIILSTGSSFVVSGYLGDSTAIIKAREGSVDVRIGTQTQTLSAGQALLIDSSDATRTPSADEVGEAAGWVDGNLAIVNRPLREVLPQLQRWYTLDANVQDLKLLDRPVTFHSPVGSSDQAISEIEKSGNLKFSKSSGNVMLFVDAGGGKAKGPGGE